jgi:hypothetical protein
MICLVAMCRHQALLYDNTLLMTSLHFPSSQNPSFWTKSTTEGNSKFSSCFYSLEKSIKSKIIEQGPIRERKLL